MSTSAQGKVGTKGECKHSILLPSNFQYTGESDYNDISTLPDLGQTAWCLSCRQIIQQNNRIIKKSDIVDFLTGGC